MWPTLSLWDTSHSRVGLARAGVPVSVTQCRCLYAGQTSSQEAGSLKASGQQQQEEEAGQPAVRSPDVGNLPAGLLDTWQLLLRTLHQKGYFPAEATDRWGSRVFIGIHLWCLSCA